MYEFIESVEIVAIVWTACLVFLAAFSGCLFKALRNADRRSVRRLHDNQQGAAYSLSFVMVLPFLVVVLGMIVETSNLLVAKAGTMYAAFNAARAAAVWTTVNEEKQAFDQLDKSDLAQRKAERAAVTAMTPFAGGLQKDTTKDTATTSEADVFVNAYEDYVAKDRKQLPVKLDYIRNKYAYAKRNTRVELEFVDSKQGEPWLNGVSAEVTYDAPFLTPFIGRLLGATVKNKRVVYEIKSQAVLPNECPRNETGHLGIRAVPGL